MYFPTLWHIIMLNCFWNVLNICYPSMKRLAQILFKLNIIRTKLKICQTFFDAPLPSIQQYSHYRNKHCLTGTWLCFALTIHSPKQLFIFMRYCFFLLSFCLKCHTNTSAVIHLRVQYTAKYFEPFKYSTLFHFKVKIKTNTGHFYMRMPTSCPYNPKD